MFVPFDPAGALTPFGDLCNFVPPPPRVPPSMPGRGCPRITGQCLIFAARSHELMPLRSCGLNSAALAHGSLLCMRAGTPSEAMSDAVDSSTGANGNWDEQTSTYRLFANRR